MMAGEKSAKGYEQSQNAPRVTTKARMPFALYTGILPAGGTGPSKRLPGKTFISSNSKAAKQKIMLQAVDVPQKTGDQISMMVARIPFWVKAWPSSTTEPLRLTQVCHMRIAAGGQRTIKSSGESVRRAHTKRPLPRSELLDHVVVLN